MGTEPLRTTRSSLARPAPCASGNCGLAGLSAAQLRDAPHLAARAAFPAVTRPDKGMQRVVAPPWRFGATPAAPLLWTPDMGADNRAVFCNLLGIDKSELAGPARDAHYLVKSAHHGGHPPQSGSANYGIR